MECVVLNAAKRIEYRPFEPEGISGETFLARLWEQQEDEVNKQLTHAIFGEELLPVNPNPDRWLTAFVVKSTEFEMEADGMVPANLKVSNGGFTYRWWFFLPIEVTADGRSKAENVFHMVRHCYGSLLNGTTLDQFPSPFVNPDVMFNWRSERTSLSHMRKALILAKNWNDTLPREFLVRGGKAGTEAQNIARRLNLAKYNETRKADTDKSAEQLMAALDKGLSYAEIAKTLGKSEESVARAAARARARLGES
ncbi:MAG: hypothetical protein JWR35_3923 [Marmoricola sp.]|nr:hypothetical protein [Marmoricola sp.]